MVAGDSFVLLFPSGDSLAKLSHFTNKLSRVNQIKNANQPLTAPV